MNLKRWVLYVIHVLWDFTINGCMTRFSDHWVYGEQHWLDIVEISFPVWHLSEYLFTWLQKWMQQLKKNLHSQILNKFWSLQIEYRIFINVLFQNFGDMFTVSYTSWQSLWTVIYFFLNQENPIWCSHFIVYSSTKRMRTATLKMKMIVTSTSWPTCPYKGTTFKSSIITGHAHIKGLLLRVQSSLAHTHMK